MKRLFALLTVGMLAIGASAANAGTIGMAQVPAGHGGSALVTPVADLDVYIGPHDHGYRRHRRPAVDVYLDDDDGGFRYCRRWRHECADRWGWDTWRYRRCMRRHDC